jgi:hypothetical protein
MGRGIRIIRQKKKSPTKVNRFYLENTESASWFWVDDKMKSSLKELPSGKNHRLSPDYRLSSSILEDTHPQKREAFLFSKELIAVYQKIPEALKYVGGSTLVDEESPKGYSFTYDSERLGLYLNGNLMWVTSKPIALAMLKDLPLIGNDVWKNELWQPILTLRAQNKKERPLAEALFQKR